jgi:Protein of unknown function (DUF3224)
MKISVLVSAGILGLFAASLSAAAPRSFTLIAVQTSQTANGAVSSFHEVLSSGKKVVAHDSVKCVESTKDEHCNGTFTFVAGGTLRVHGTINATEVIPIVSGTGSFAGAKGTMHLRNLSKGRTQLTFDLT